MKFFTRQLEYFYLESNLLKCHFVYFVRYPGRFIPPKSTGNYQQTIIHLIFLLVDEKNKFGDSDNQTLLYSLRSSYIHSEVVKS